MDYPESASPIFTLSQMAKEELSTELRLLLAFALSFLVIVMSRSLLVKPLPPAAPKAVAKQSQPPPLPPADATPQAPLETKGESKQGTAEEQITVESDLYQVVFSSKGAVVKNWALKGFKDEQNQPLDLVDPVAAHDFGYPFALWVNDPAVRQEINGALFVPSATGHVHTPVTLTFEYSGPHFAARKEILFPERGYVVEIKTDLWIDGKPMPHTVGWRGGFGDIHDLGMRGNVVDVFYRDQQKITRLGPSDIKGEEATASGTFLYAGIEDRFFSASFMPQQGALNVFAFRQDISVAGQTKKRPSIGMAAGSLDSPQNRLRLFVGPKDTEILASVQPQLPDLVDYGWFALVAKPLFVAMRWIHDHIVANWGWSIILLTLVINTLMFPLKVKSLRSGMKMQKVQPQIKAVQEKYKQYKMNDPRKAEMNKELMELYKKHGVNPVGGCLPMLLQMPFLYGFYKVLVVSIEMRHAPWILWVTDLSAPEHISIRVLPLAMCATQFILQRMSPATTPDPAQQKVMMFMPIMFLFLFWNLSSGLVLYWLTGNLVGIVQQWYINRTELQHVIADKKTAKSGKKKIEVRK